MRPFDEGPRPKSDKWRLNLQDPILEGKSIGLNPKTKRKKQKKLQRGAHDLKNQDAKLRTEARSNSRIQFGFK
jgi:hypothetical protein